MIETFFRADALGTPAAFFLSFLIGVGFGAALEQAGFGSSRRLCGIFYFRDMTVLKVMFTAVITAMLGLSYALAMGLIAADSINLLETIYGAQVVGGLVFGVGFVVGGWCPGTAAVGLASGRLDALVFLGGAMLGSLLFNEGYFLVKPLTTLGNRGISQVFDLLGVGRPVFAFWFALIAVLSFWGAEAIEIWAGTGGFRKRAPSLVLLTLGLLVGASGLFLPIFATPASPVLGTAAVVPGPGMTLLQAVDQGEDHVEPEDLADRLLAADPELILVDIRSPQEFSRFHLPGARNIPLGNLEPDLQAFKNRGTIVLYSNGMTHPAQARDQLARNGFNNAFILTDGLSGFLTRCLKPVSLRGEPVPQEVAARINRWRTFFQSSQGLPAK